MIIENLQWDEFNINHISRHNITPEEVEEVFFNGDISPRIERGRNNRYYILGQTFSGQYIFVVSEYLGKGKIRPITARDMTASERKRFESRCNK
jgi:uncharacterized DUF497 family protein